MRSNLLTRSNMQNTSRLFLRVSNQSRAMSFDVSQKMAARVSLQGKSIWNEFAALARDCNAVNIGQGFTDSPPPTFMTDALKSVVNSSNHMLHQYARGFGHLRLVNVLADLYTDLLQHEVNALEDVTVSIGGYNALFMAIFAFINPGDEAIIIEPYFDCYSPQVEMAGGVPVFVPLRPVRCRNKPLASGDYKLDLEEFESKFSAKTKLLILNNPNNPLGKVFTREELLQIAHIAQKYNVLVISDEVYEWIIYSGNEMVRFASLPDMFDRTVTIGSAGKVFSMTGWKLGWVIAPKRISEAIRALHQNCTYTCPTPLQEAVAIGFEHEIPLLGTEKSYFQRLCHDLLAKRDKMSKFLDEMGMEPILPQGGYFIMADYSSLGGAFDSDAATAESRDFQFVRWMCKEKKLAAIPPTAFYSKPHVKMGENFVRFCFFKEEATLEAAEQIFRNWKSSA